MTRIGFVADVHLGNHKRQGGPLVASLNQRCRETLAVLRAAYDRAEALDCEAFYVLGDLFDTNSPPPQLIHEAQRILSGSSKMRSYLLVGNHDMTSSAPDDHALGPLSLTVGDMVEVIDEPRVNKHGGTHVLAVPFQSGDARAWLPDVVRDYAKAIVRAERAGRAPPTKLLLAIHLGIRDPDTPYYLQDSHDAIDAADLADLCVELGISAVAAGNWHDRKLWKRTTDKSAGTALEILQLGALVPTGWDNLGLEGYGTLAVWDGVKFKWEELPGPRFVKLSPGETTDKPARGTILYAEQVRDTAKAEQAAREAASAACSATTLEEALGRYVEAMPLDEGIDRADVLAKAKEYLA